MIVFPAPLESTSTTDDSKFYGFAEIIKYDENGNVVYTQTVHNQLVDTGEEFLLDAVFQDGGTDVADAVQIGSICVTDAASPTIAEGEAAADFDGDNGMVETNCIEDTTVTTSGGTAVIGPLTFTAGTHTAVDDTITAIGICQNDVTDDTPFNNCASEGILFAVVNTSDVTLATGETVDITYTFDITSASS
jgi:hypothetical protein